MLQKRLSSEYYCDWRKMGLPQIDICPEENMLAWFGSAGDRPRCASWTILDHRVDDSMSLFYHKVMQDGGTINSERYLDFLERTNVQSIWAPLPRWEMVVQQNNARSHVLRHVKEWLTAHFLLKQSLYSPDTKLMNSFKWEIMNFTKRATFFQFIRDRWKCLPNFLMQSRN